jgi:signal transduction histidine kinase
VLDGSPIRLSDVELAANGADVPVDVTLSPIPGDDGGCNAYVAIVRDMREQRAAALARERLNRALEAQAADLVAANERLSSLGATLSHDLQQPLVALGGFLHLLSTRRGDVFDADAKSWVEASVRSQQRLSDAVQALARTALDVPVQLEPVDLELVVGEAVEDLELQGLDLAVDLGSIRPVLGDRAMLSRVVANLLSNSARYRHPDRPATVTVEQRPSTDGAVVVAFADNGRGFSDDEVDAVFRGGLRGSAAAGTNGTGTGLAIVRRTIAALDGRVWAERGDPHGAVVCIALRPAERTG